MDTNHHGNPADNLDPYGYPYTDGRGIDGSLAAFLMNHNIKFAWVAFFALWVYWGLLWFVRHAFGDGHMNADYGSARANADGDEAAAAAATTGTTAAAATGWRGWVRKPRVVRTYSRLSRATDVLRDLVLMLLSVLILNTLGRGATRSVMILAWVFFAFAVIWSIFEASYESHIARLVFGAIFYGLALAIAALAFKHGFEDHYSY